MKNSLFDYRDLQRICLEALVILVLAVLIGLAINFPLVKNLLEGKLTSPPAGSGQGREQSYPEPVELATVRAQLAAGAVLLDARSQELYAEGHIPGGRSLPLDEAELQLAGLQAEFPPETPLLTYCSGYGCPDSFDLAMLLIEAGYQRVMVFEGGFPEWRDAGLPVAKGQP